MNIYNDQTDLVLASWRAARRRERLAFLGLMGTFLAALAGGIAAYWLTR